MGDSLDSVANEVHVDADDLDNGEASVTTLEVCGEAIVATRHTLFWTPSHENIHGSSSVATSSSSPSKFFTRNSITRGMVINHEQALLACFREISLRFVPDGDRIAFACEIKSSSPKQATFFFIITSNRGINPTREESMILVVTKRQIEETNGDDSIKLLAGIPVLSSMSIEFRGRGVFGIHLGERIIEENGFFFETKSLHSMWTAIVSLEKVRDQAKTDNLYESESTWMLDYFPIEDETSKRVEAKSTITRHASHGEGDQGETDPIDPEEEGEGGTSLIVIPPALSSQSNTIKTTPSNSFSLISNVKVMECEPGITKRMFSLSALKKNLNRNPTRRNLISGRSYEKPSLDRVFSAIFDFVSSAQDPDDLSVSDVIDFLKTEFGEEIIGKLGYSSAKIDSLIYKVVGQMEPPSKIVDGLYLGSEYNAANKQELQSLGVTHVLNVTAEVDKFFPDDFKYHQVCVLDTPNAKILPFFERALEFIEWALNGKNGIHGACLVHCQRGVSRSASFVVAYLVKVQNMSVEEAIKFVKERRRIIKPNTGFVSQLKQWEQLCRLEEGG